MKRIKCYAPMSVNPGDSISYNAISEYATWQGEPQIEVGEVPHCSYGDYDGSTMLERSNHRVMLANHPELLNVSGGSNGLWYIGTLEDQTEELQEAIAALESYPCIDESDWSELETEQEWAEWCDWGRGDFVKALSVFLADTYEDRTIELDRVSDSVIDELWYDGTDAFNLNGGPGVVWDGGGNCHFMIDDWVKAAGDTREANSEWARDARAKIKARLDELMQSRGWIVPKTDSDADTAIADGICRIGEILGTALTICLLGIAA